MKTYSNEFIEKLLKTVENPDLPGIYLIENKSTGKKYVGQTSVSLQKRLIQHISSHNGIKKIIPKADGSSHYKCYLDG